MKINLKLFLGLCLLSLSVQSQENKQSNMGKAPTSKKIATVLTSHGHQRVDNYHWMNERDNTDVLSYINEENEYAKNYFNRLESLQETLLNEFENRIDPNEVSSPFYINGKLYQIRNKAGKDYHYIYLIEGEKETLFFDENKRAKGKSFYDLADWNPSTDNNLVAISEDFVGRRNYEITFRTNKTGEFLKDKIENTDGSLVWANDNKTVYYVKKDAQTLREFQIYKHTLGTDSKQDELIFEEKDERFSVFIDKSLTRKFVEIHVQSSLTSEIWLLDADQVHTSPRVFLKRETGHLYSIDHHTNGFYITSNKNAPNRKLLFSKEIPKGIESCTVILEHDTASYLEQILVLHEFIAVESRMRGLQKISIINLETQTKSIVQLDEETYALNFGLNDDYKATRIFYSYNSLTTPPTVYDYDLKTSTQQVFHQKKLLDKNFDPSHYESQRIWATANDGAQIAVSLVYKKGLDLEKAPVLLYGYGSYGITIPDVFSAIRLSLIDRGFVFAIAHIRGEKYLGETWYESGKFLKKQNTFTDFINAAEYLGMKGYCDKNRIYAQGGSAGGLLMGAVANMAPYLWKGIVAQVPFVDVVTTMLDETIPLTVGEYEEWGNPNEENYYYYMLNYSPYDNVRSMAYPAMFVTTGYHDSQVQYWEPLKWIAKLRELKTDNNPLLFDCNLDAGHGGGSGRTSERKEIAKEFAFILDLEKIEK
jgi:oligopeptidase B